MKLKTLITLLALYQLQHKSQIFNALTPEKNWISEDIICTYKLEWWTKIMLLISVLGVAGFFILKE